MPLSGLKAIVLERSADVRYVGEGHEVLVALPPGLAGAAAVEHMWSAFHRAHDDTFGFHYEGSQDVEVVNLPAEFSETRYPVIVERLELATDSGGAGCRRGGFGYDKRVRALEDCEALSNADRALINTYGVNGGKYGGTYSLEIDSPDGTVRKLAGMEDRVPVAAGSTIRIRTTGGGGWGDPLAREPEMVCYDVQCGLVSEQAARDDYGVVLGREGRRYTVDQAETDRLRVRVRAERGPLPMFSRGPYFEQMKHDDKIVRPAGHDDPDDGWFAGEVMPEAAE